MRLSFTRLLLANCISICIVAVGISAFPASDNSVQITLNRVEWQLGHEKLDEQSLSQLSTVVSHNPTNYYAHILLGSSCDFLGLPEQAEQQYRVAFRYCPEQSGAFLSLIKHLMKTNQAKAASSLLQKAAKREPVNPQILMMAGNALYKEKKYQEAESLYKQAMQSNHSPAQGLMTGLASLKLEEGDNYTAFKLAKRDLASDKNLPQANTVAGLALVKMGQLERAVPYLKIAFANDMQSYQISSAYGQALIWCGKYNEALLPSLCSLISAETELKAKPKENLAKIAPRLSLEAVKHAQDRIKALSLAVKSVDLYLQLANIYVAKNCFDEAILACKRAAQIAPQSAEARYELALILETYKHDYTAALLYLREAYAIAPYNKDMKQHLMRLEELSSMDKKRN